MKRVVVHIGSHKTGTSSLQGFLATNAVALGANGVCYGTTVHSARNVNFLANRIANADMASAGNVTTDLRTKATRSKAHTVLLSAESFYAMSAFFGGLVGKPAKNYWAEERNRVAALRGLFEDVELRVVCYLRRQDDFATSLYNQFVKQAPGYAGDLGSFVSLVGETWDYDGHVALWESIAGPDNVVVRPFDPKGGIFDDFLKHGLGLSDTSAFTPIPADINVSMPGPWLDVKRGINRIDMDSAEQHAASFVVDRLSRETTLKAPWPGLDTTAVLANLMSASLAGNARLAKRHADMDFLLRELSGGSPRDDPGAFDPDVHMTQLVTMAEAYRAGMRAPDIRAGIVMRRAWAHVSRCMPWAERCITAVRRMRSRRRLRRELAGGRK